MSSSLAPHSGRWERRCKGSGAGYKWLKSARPQRAVEDERHAEYGGVFCQVSDLRRSRRLTEDTTMIVKLLPADAHNERTINQGHPPNWQNPPGGNYDLVVLGGGPAGLIAA